MTSRISVATFSIKVCDYGDDVTTATGEFNDVTTYLVLQMAYVRDDDLALIADWSFAPKTDADWSNHSVCFCQSPIGGFG